MIEEHAGPADWYRRHRRVLVPILLALFFVLLAALGFSRVWGVFLLLPDTISPWWTLVTALPACLLVFVKERAPMAALAAASVLFVVDLVTLAGVGPLIVLLDVFWTAVFVAGPRARRRLAAAVVIAASALFLAAVLLAETPGPVAFLVSMQFGAFLGTDYWWAVAVSQANELAELHRQRADEAERAAARDRAEAVRLEREAMARELHDAVAGHVMAMAIRAEAALSTEPDQDRDRAALRAVRDAGLDAHAALRSMIAVLRSGDGGLQPTPRLEDLTGIADDARRAGLQVSLRDGLDGRLDPSGATAQAIVRVVREALTNCVRHAPGAVVDVELALLDGGADGRGEPDRRGAGFDAPVLGERESVEVRVESRGGLIGRSGEYSGGGWGLSMLTERVRALGGTFSAGPTADGWSVRAQLPTGVRA